MCLSPISIKTVDAFNLPVNMSVPCGKCIECMKDRQNSWKIRLAEEAKVHKYVYFFTLTYNEDNVPFVVTEAGERVRHVSKTDIQLWNKRSRINLERSLGRSIDYKYFITSEYGPSTGRPHYHGILYTDVEPVYIASIFNDWNERFGFTNWSSVGRQGKKKLLSLVSYLSTIMLQNIASNHVSWLPKPNYVFTNILAPELYLTLSS